MNLKTIDQYIGYIVFCLWQYLSNKCGWKKIYYNYS